MRFAFFLLVFWSACSISNGIAQAGLPFEKSFKLKGEQINVEIPIGKLEPKTGTSPKSRKLKAALLTVFLGHFGVHRIYLGTSPNVPIVYSLTLGGGLGLLPLADLIAILSTKDLEKFTNSDKVFMWLN